MLLAHAYADHFDQNLEETFLYKLGQLARIAWQSSTAAEMAQARDKFEKLLRGQVAEKLVNQIITLDK